MTAYCGRLARNVNEASVVVVLKPKPENPHDPNAVAVFVAREKVGYFGR